MTGRTRPLEAVPALSRLAARQDGIVRRDQLAALDITRDHVRSQVRAQRWRLLTPTVIALHTGRLTRRQQMWAGVLHAGRHSALASFTALERSGLGGWDRPDVHVVVPQGVTVSRQPGLRVHTSRRPLSRQVDVEPPCIEVARAALDAARGERNRRTASGLVLAVVQQRLATPEELAACLAEIGPMKHRNAVRSAIGHSAAGSDSLAEVDAERVIRRAGLPTPRRQVVIETPLGRRRVDLVVDLPDGSQLAIEIDGPTHSDPRVRAADAIKDAALIAAGVLVLHIPASMLRLDPDTVLAQLVEIRRGALRRTS